MRSLIQLLFLTVLTTWAPYCWCQASEDPDWVCVPQQILIGQWKIEIRANDAVTSYMPEISIGRRPLMRTFAITGTPANERIRFSGYNFDMVVYAGLAPDRNPFFPEGAVAADVIFIQYSDRAFLKNRPFACRARRSA